MQGSDGIMPIKNNRDNFVIGHSVLGIRGGGNNGICKL
ncbi:hypothetical protein TPY_2765 [Sulfobacillus acidophilus TPY]|nr:hypothetical protein TPY_2765 [Sulfobacillus acidophilus TPY]